ncbi:MAG: arginase [Myxococcota bacterium]
MTTSDLRSSVGLGLLVADSELGGAAPGPSLGPQALITSALARGLERFGSVDAWCRAPHLRREHFARPSLDFMGEFADYVGELCARHAEALDRSQRTLLLSGDHSNAIGWVAGAREAMPDARIGLVWIDAHGDIHSPWTSPSGNLHGLPVAAMLGLDHVHMATREPSAVEHLAWEELKHLGPGRICPKLRPEDVFYVDIRDLEPEEWRVLEERSIPHLTARDFDTRGVERVIDEVTAYFAEYDALYVSFDVDSVDPQFIQGTGTPVPGGMTLEDAALLLGALVAHPAWTTLEITEINPLQDTRNQTAERLTDVLVELWGTLARGPRTSS